MIPLFVTLSLTLLCNSRKNILSEAADTTLTQIVISAPVNPVVENGMLSLHCQVWNVEPGYTVTLSQIKDGAVRRITWGKDILSGGFGGDRVFLATRQLHDGSVVYFLTFTEVSRMDKGTYTCAVLTDSLAQIASHTVHVDVHYFPEDINPVCVPNESPVAYEGVPFRMGCSSEEASPSVKLRWIRTGTGKKKNVPLHLETKDKNGMVRAEIEVIPTVHDQDAVFLCELTSPVFPDRLYTCHVGPITVVPSTDYYEEGGDGGGDWNSSPPPIHPTQKNTAVGDNSAGTFAAVPSNTQNAVDQVRPVCQESCSSFSTPVYYWMIATGAASVFAVLFLLIIVAFYIRIRIHNPTKRHLQPSFLSSKDVYVEVDQKYDENRLYMSLDRAKHKTMNSNLTPLDYGSDYNPTKQTSRQFEGGLM